MQSFENPEQNNSNFLFKARQHVGLVVSWVPQLVRFITRLYEGKNPDPIGQISLTRQDLAVGTFQKKKSSSHLRFEQKDCACAKSSKPRLPRSAAATRRPSVPTSAEPPQDMQPPEVEPKSGLTDNVGERSYHSYLVGS